MRKTDTYHHGHLRASLLATARALLQEGGVEALNLREIARRAGVSTAAPYHHFADKASLIQALVQESLVELDRVSREAIQGLSSPREKLSALGVAYVMYAIDHPAEFRLMFRPEKGSPIELPNPSEALVYGVLRGVVDEGCAAGIFKGDREIVAITAWSLVHGLAALLVDGPLYTLAGSRDAVRELAIQVTRHIEVT